MVGGRGSRVKMPDMKKNILRKKIVFMHANLQVTDVRVNKIMSKEKT